MSESTITTLHKSHAHKPSFLHFLTIMMTLMMWVWGECAWAEFRNFHLVLAKGDAECLVTEAEFATQYTPVEFGYVVNNDGTVRRVEKDDPSSMGTIKGKSHSEHGITNFEMTVNVDGGVKVGMGTCNWGGDVKINGATSFNTSNSDHCWHTDKVNNIAYGHYVGGAGTITISGGSYTAYVSVEAETVTTHRVSFSLGSVVCEGTLLPVGSDVVDGESFTIPKNCTLYKEGNTLTGWTDGTNTYNIGDDFTPTADVTLNPVFRQNTKALDDRTSAVTLLWDFQRNNGAPTVNVQGGSGIWVIQANVNGESIDVKMEYDATSGKLNNANWGDWCQINEGTKLTFPSCKDATVTAFVMNNLTTTTIGGSVPAMSGNNASATITSSNATQQLVAGDEIKYIRTLQVLLPVVAVPTPSEYDATVTNVEQLKTALTTASGTSEYKIFVKNGTYDLGTEINTQVKNYTTIIGESRDGVIIKNQPTTEGLGSSATLKVGSNVTLKDITLKCRAPYTNGAERGVCLWDAGTGNSYENICIDGLQDAYYSNGTKGMTNTFTDCIIRGTVDFICGSGNITFNNCTLEVVKSHNGVKSIIAAPATYTEETGYVFNNCTIKASEAAIGCTVLTRAASEHATGTVADGGYYLARGWYAGNETTKGADRTPKAAFNNSTLNIAPTSEKWAESIGYAQAEERAVFTDGTEPKPFNDFTIDLTVTEPVLPNGVTKISYPGHGASRHGERYGWCWYAIEFAVDGPVNVYVGGCEYNNGNIAYITDKDGNKLADIDNKSGGAGGLGSYLYTGEAQTLKLYCGQYCPSIRVEKPKVETFSTVWDWTTMKPTALDKTYQSVNKWIDNADGAGIYIGAADGKYRANTTNVQLSKGTKIIIPVYGKDDKIIIDAYGSSLTSYDVNGTNYTDDAEITVTSANVSNGYIEIVSADNNDYLNKITLNHTKIEPSSRTFTDFKINFTGESSINPSTTYYVTSTDANGKATYTSTEPATYLATFKGQYHGTTYGITGTPVITIPVDGPVKIYYGTNDYGADVTVKNSDGQTVGSMNTNGGKWSASKPEENLACVIYNSETPTVLTLTGGGYIPFIKAEACDLIPQVTVTYYNTDGTTVIGSETVAGSSVLAYKYGESDVAVPTGSKFRGWFNSKCTDVATFKGKKVPEGTALNDNLSLYAVATPIETSAKGSTYTYDLTKDYFYLEDHEGINITGGSYYNNHGWSFSNNGTIAIPVPGDSKITFTLCQYGNGGKTSISSSNGGTITPSSFDTKVGSDGTAQTIEYKGPATTLTFTLGSGGYIHSINVKNAPLAPSDLAILSEKETVLIYPTQQYTLRKNVDYTDSYASGTYTYTSSNTEIANVDANGVITAGSSYGRATITVHHDATDNMAAGEIHFSVNVISANGETHKPTVVINDDGTATITKSADETNSTFYYTLDGTEPTTESETTSGTLDAATLDGKVLKIIANADGKSPSNVVTAYINVAGTFTWTWDEGSGELKLKPVISDEVKDAVDVNTMVIVGNNLTTGWANGVDDKTFAIFNPTETPNAPDIRSALQFNVIPLIGIKFKPTAVSFNASRTSNTSAGSLDAKIMFDKEYNLLTNVRPAGSWEDDVKYTSYPNATDVFTTDVSSIAAADEEFALNLYIYNLAHDKPCAFRDVIISGTFTGTEYDGECYTVTAAANPLIGGQVTHHPSASRVKAGKSVTFTAYPSEGYRFKNWTLFDSDESLGTDKTYTIASTSADADLEANFEKLPIVTFANEEKVLVGVVPEARYVGEDNSLKMPYGYRLYGEGWTLTGWTDGTTEYKCGETYSFTEDITLKAVIVRNENVITDANTSTTVHWNFDTKVDRYAAPWIEIAKESFDYTKQVKVNEMPLDIKMTVDVTNSKYTSTDPRVNGFDGVGCQMNDGAILKIPAVDGMIVRIKASEKYDYDTHTTTYFTGDNCAKIQFGQPDYYAYAPNGNIENKLITYNYTGDDEFLFVKIEKAGSVTTWGFFEYLEVVYPALPDVLMEKVVTSKAVAGINDDPKNAGTVTKTATTHHNTGIRYKQGDNVTITATADYGYYISAIKSGDTPLTMTKVEPSADATQPTKATATYIVGATTGTVTVEYTRLPMGKVRLESADKKLGDVDFESSSIHANFYSKGEGWAESWFVVENTEAATSIPADDYVIDKWTDANGTQLVTTNSYNITVTAEPQTFFAYFKHGEMGSVTFDIENPVIDVNGVITALPGNFGANYDANSQAPSAVTNSYSFTVPKYHTVFKTGYTLKYWKNKDNNNKYQLGTNYSFQTVGENITLVPVYVENPSDQMNRTNDPIMLYEFGTGKGIRAQQVKIEKNTETYWTAQVHVVTITDGKEHPHDRDVAMWINTGAKGFVRNGDLPEWASFGPGTEFTIASCAGTRVEILSYAPISTTTFGGQPFTLVSADEEKHEYIYECTTQSTEARVPIVIGDDYSYYKYIKVYSLKANRVNLHIDVDDPMRGHISLVDAINKAVPDPIMELKDGGQSFHQGNSVKVVFKRRFGQVFDRIVDMDKIGTDGKPLAILEMLDNGNVKMVKIGNGTDREEVVANSGGNSWGSSSTLSTHVFYLNRTEPAPADDMVDSLRTEYELQFNITTHRNLQVCFKEKPTFYVTYNAGKQAVGTAPAAAWIEANDKFRIPENRTLFYEGYTLKFWKDAEYDETKTYDTNKTDGHVYEIGHEYINPGKDILLYPVFEKNTFGLLDIPAGEGLKVRWPFASNLGAPTINYEQSSGILVSQLKKSATEWIDLKIDLDGSAHKDASGKNVYGKFNNTADDDRCQINTNSILTLPTTTNCEITLSADNEISSTVIAGSTTYAKGNTVTATYNGNLGQQTIDFKNDGRYYAYLDVAYKKQTTAKPTLTSVKYGTTELTADQLTTLTTNKSVSVTVEPDIVNDAVPTVTATSNGGVVTIAQADINNRSAIITLKTTGGVLAETYSVDFKFNLPETTPKLLKYVINGEEYQAGREVIIDDAPVSGVVKLVFDRTMAAMSVVSPVYGTTYSAEQGKELVFYYWNLPVNTVSRLLFPSSIFEDVYGKKPDDFNVDIHLSVGSTTMPVTHRTFDYIVSKDGDINGAIAAANAATGTDRYYVFIPDGEYELKGNQNITSAMTSDGVAPADSTGTNRGDLIGQTFNNGMTQISRANVSLIGQSTQGVTLFNRPLLEGIGYTATIHIGKNATDFYAEDLQLVNRFPYKKSLNSQGTSGAGRAVAFWDQGNRSIMKNVEMWSYQDTYYSSNASPDYRGYFENCTLAGVVDWLCGDGNIWLEKCDIVIRDRAGNNISAPSQENTQLWGYVFNECNIKPEDENPKELGDKNWSLARPWANATDKSPAATFLNTKMWLLPRDAGWEKMGTGAVLRFHEYRSQNKSGALISLGSRSLAACAPAAGSDDCILSAADAARYTLENVMGGNDLFTPKAFTQQIDAASNNDQKDWDANNSLTWNDDIEIDDDRLQWRTERMALCYFVFKKDEASGKWKYITNVAQSTEDETVTGLSLERYGDGIYCVRAANQRGGLGAPTKEIEFKVSEKYTLEIKKAATVDGVDYGWSTICLPYNSKVPTIDINGDTKEGFKVYAANGVNPNAASESEMFDTEHKNKVTDYYLYLKSVTVINKNQGYVVYGPVGQYQFASSSHTSDVVTILKGNPDTEAIPTGNNNGYVLANKSTYGVGFYKYTGGTLAANRAWLPVDMVDNKETNTPNNFGSTAFLRLVIISDDENTAIDPVIIDHPAPSVIYDLMGTRILTPTPGRIYIVDGKKVLWR